MPAPHTRESLFHDLQTLGVAPADTLWVHSSYKSIGTVEGGAATVIAALEDAVGPQGTLLMPAFNLAGKTHKERAASWDLETSPATTGWLCEFFRTLPGTVRSDHYSHSVAARGKDAEAWVSDHRLREGAEAPWDLPSYGYTFGNGSPLMKAYRAGVRVLMLGVDYHSATSCHIAEVLWWNRKRQTDPGVKFHWIDRDRFGETYWDQQGQLERGRVGDADCRLFSMKAFIDALLEAVEREPERWFKWYQ